MRRLNGPPLVMLPTKDLHRHRERLKAAWRSSSFQACKPRCFFSGLPHALRAFAMTGKIYGIQWRLRLWRRSDAAWLSVVHKVAWRMRRLNGPPLVMLPTKDLHRHRERLKAAWRSSSFQACKPRCFFSGLPHALRAFAMTGKIYGIQWRLRLWRRSGAAWLFKPFAGGEEERLLFGRIGFFFCIQSIMP